MSGRVIVGLSGGVDSAVAALLLKERGHEVHGLHMTNWQEDEAGYCTAAEDHQAALAVARELGIPLHRVSFAQEYRDRVFRHFLDEYAAGRTPNPDVLCNREVKFGACLAYAQRLGGSWFATGHYARIAHDAERPRLLRARDVAKAQTYVLQQLSAASLAHTRFPLGDLEKPAVRAIARRAGLPVHDRPDSTGICFIGERPFREFLERYLPARPGDIETEDGTVVGRHDGLMYYTLGQRQGLGLGGRAGAPEQPWYVADKDVARNALVVVQGHDHPRLRTARFATDPATWIAPAPDGPFETLVQVRHRQAPVRCRVTPRAAGLAVELEAPLRAVAPGQYAAFYAGPECLGGAVITAVETRYNSKVLFSPAAEVS
ncbi:MAG: tRNA 2-thiouridine(34) synthase MnmA [Pseudomonadota bacterium]